MLASGEKGPFGIFIMQQIGYGGDYMCCRYYMGFIIADQRTVGEVDFVICEERDSRFH